MAKFAVYVFDYGAPIGFRLAVMHPERISAIVNPEWQHLPRRRVRMPSRRFRPTGRSRRRQIATRFAAFLAPQTTLFQYTHGVADPSLVSPDGRNLDDFYLARPGNAEIQLDLLLDYQSNVALYDTIQAYLRQHQPPVLAVWGKKTIRSSSRPARKRSNGMSPRQRSIFVDSGHFALETHAREIGAVMRAFLVKHIG